MERKTFEAKKLIAIFLVVVFVCLTAVSALVIYVDPFFHYHAPLDNFPYVVDNQLSQNPGMARNMNYDSCIIGSSMTVNFHTSDFASLMGLNTLKLSYSGAYPRDDYNILSIVYDENGLPTKVFYLDENGLPWRNPSGVYGSIDKIDFLNNVIETYNV